MDEKYVEIHGLLAWGSKVKYTKDEKYMQSLREDPNDRFENKLGEDIQKCCPEATKIFEEKHYSFKWYPRVSSAKNVYDELDEKEKNTLPDHEKDALQIIFDTYNNKKVKSYRNAFRHVPRIKDRITKKQAEKLFWLSDSEKKKKYLDIEFFVGSTGIIYVKKYGEPYSHEKLNPQLEGYYTWTRARFMMQRAFAQELKPLIKEIKKETKEISKNIKEVQTEYDEKIEPYRVLGYI